MHKFTVTHDKKEVTIERVSGGVQVTIRRGIAMPDCFIATSERTFNAPIQMDNLSMMKACEKLVTL